MRLLRHLKGKIKLHILYVSELSQYKYTIIPILYISYIPRFFREDSLWVEIKVKNEIYLTGTIYSPHTSGVFDCVGV